MRKILHLSFLPRNIDPALLVLRVWLGFTLLGAHGLDKLTGFSQMAPQFAGVLPFGGPVNLGLVVFAEVVCSLLVAIGLFTRLASLILIINFAVAFGMAHHFVLKGPHSGELAFLYLGGFVTTLLAGAGRFSIDNGLLKAERKP